jgi:hypothetical protein
MPAVVPFVSGAFLQFFDNSGAPLAGGLVFTYQAGGTVPQATYTDSTGATPNPNPVVLDSAGRADIWCLAASYRFDLKTAGGVLIRTEDNIVGNALTAVSTVTANTVYAGPSTGAAAVPAFRALVAADIPSLSTSSADVALDNLASVNINTPLLFQTGIDVGSTAKAPRFLYFWGAGAFGTTSFRLTGTPTANRILTLQDSSDTIVGRATTDTLTNKTLASPVFTGKLAGPPLLTPVLLSADGAIAPHTPAWNVITKGSAAALTLAAPTAGTDDGLTVGVQSSTAFAHVITATGLLQTGSASVNTATFAAFAGAGLILRAYNAKWLVIAQIGITFA